MLLDCRHLLKVTLTLDGVHFLGVVKLLRCQRHRPSFPVTPLKLLIVAKDICFVGKMRDFLRNSE
jgi:hypothetical protein